MKRPTTIRFAGLFLIPFGLALLWPGPIPAAPLKVGGDAHFPPYEYLNQNGEPDGFDVELMEALARVMNLSIDLELGRWSEIRARLEAGEIDAIPGMIRSKDREVLLDFSEPFLTLSYAIFLRKDSTISSLAELRGRNIVI
ncbi:transporter substrate-binding domain-containing protein, partial [bacterium]|nr:transporter substrate-binding domain-containing protein [bacterium]